MLSTERIGSTSKLTSSWPNELKLQEIETDKKDKEFSDEDLDDDDDGYDDDEYYEDDDDDDDDDFDDDYDEEEEDDIDEDYDDEDDLDSEKVTTGINICIYMYICI